MFVKGSELVDNIREALGPHGSELNSNTPSMLVESIQSRRVTGRHSFRSAVPAGLDPIAHFEVVCLSDSPLDTTPEVPHYMGFYLQTLKEKGERHP